LAKHSKSISPDQPVRTGLRAAGRILLRAAVSSLGALTFGQMAPWTPVEAATKPGPPAVTVLNRSRRGPAKLLLKLSRGLGFESIAGHASHSSHSSHSSHASHYSSSAGTSPRPLEPAAPSPSPSPAPSPTRPAPAPSPWAPSAPEVLRTHPKTSAPFVFSEQGAQSLIVQIIEIDLEASTFRGKEELGVTLQFSMRPQTRIERMKPQKTSFPLSDLRPNDPFPLALRQKVRVSFKDDHGQSVAIKVTLLSGS
jgi:hypothetical protein